MRCVALHASASAAPAMRTAALQRAPADVKEDISVGGSVVSTASCEAPRCGAHLVDGRHQRYKDNSSSVREAGCYPHVWYRRGRLQATEEGTAESKAAHVEAWKPAAKARSHPNNRVGLSEGSVLTHEGGEFLTQQHRHAARHRGQQRHARKRLIVHSKVAVREARTAQQGPHKKTT